MSVNKVILVGNLGQDPEVRYTASGAGVANFSIATSESWVDKSGQKQDRTEWHRVVVWGKLADVCKQYLAKGRQVYIEGRLQTRQWQDKDGQTKYTTEVNAQVVQFLGGNKSAGGASAGSGAYNSGASAGGSGAYAGGASAYGGGGNSGGASGYGGGAGAAYGGPSMHGGGAPVGGPSDFGGGGFGTIPEPSFTEDDIPF